MQWCLTSDEIYADNLLLSEIHNHNGDYKAAAIAYSIFRPADGASVYFLPHAVNVSVK